MAGMNSAPSIMPQGWTSRGVLLGAFAASLAVTVLERRSLLYTDTVRFSPSPLVQAGTLLGLILVLIWSLALARRYRWPLTPSALLPSARTLLFSGGLAMALWIAMSFLSFAILLLLVELKILPVG